MRKSATAIVLIGWSLLSLLTASASETVIKSPNDHRSYASFTLPNQLKVLIISDPTTDKAAAALDVKVGSASDPRDWQGLAHFLEHMLFLGTEKYPQPGEYKQFISSHGGSDNAYTALEDTNYYFDIDKNYLEPALDRFAQFFISPLFTEKYVTRERQVVHSEYQSKLKSDGWRVRSAQKRAANPKHPFTGFNVGSTDTLADREGRSIRDELLAFYERHYSANLMTLVVLGKEPLSTLKQWVTNKFSAVKNRQAQALEITVPMFRADQLPARLDVIPVKQSQRLSLSFPIPSLLPHYRSKPEHYINNLLGHEGRGSLLSLLKARGWVNSLWAGTAADSSREALLSVSVELTQPGLEHIDGIIELVFQTLHLIKAQGIQPWLFTEQRQLSKLSFRFQEQTAAINYVRGLAAALHRYPAQDVLRGPYAMDDYDPELILQLLNQLRPDNMLITVTAPGLITDAVDPWFKAPYRLSHIEPNLLQRWRAAALHPELALPEPNTFIPDDVTLRSSSTKPSLPQRVDTAEGLEFWHHLDTSFQVPRAEFYFSVRSPVANNTPQHAMLTELYIKLVNDALTEFSYPAQIAGLDYKLYKHMRGFSVRISGYNDKQRALLEQILATLTYPPVNNKRFALIKDELLRDLINSKKNPPYRQAYREISSLLMTPYWNDEQSQRALQTLTADDLRRFMPQLLSRLNIVALAHGNVDRDDAQQLAQALVQELLAKAIPTDVARGQLLQLQPGTDYVRELDIDHYDSTSLLYAQGPDKTYSSQAQFALLAQILESPFFDDLRTEHKLGYIVFASPMPLLEVPGLTFIVQSPIADPIILEQHYRRFLTDFAQTLANLSAAEFTKHKQSLLTRILQADQTLQERAARYWTEIDRQMFSFDTRERLAEAVQALDKATILHAYQQYLLSPNSVQLIVRSVGSNHRPDFASKAQTNAKALINDPSTFKRNHQAFSG